MVPLASEKLNSNRSEFHQQLVRLSAEVRPFGPGEIVTAKGVIRIDVDLGYGYHYETMLEEAAFSKHE